MYSIVTWNVGKLKLKIVHVLAAGRTMLVLIGLSFIFFIGLGISGIVEKGAHASPRTSMKGFASTVSSQFFMDMIGMEFPYTKKESNASTFSKQKLASLCVHLLTDINPQDPKSLLAGEVSALGSNTPILLRTGSGNEGGEAPLDYEPDSTPPARSDNDQKEGISKTQKENSIQQPNHNNPKTILIYHSHPREGYNPLMGTQSDNPSSNNPSMNVMQVGTYVAHELESKGIGVEHSQKDYQTLIDGYQWCHSYKYSRESIQKAIAQNEQLDYFIDIHRDSQRHKKTTAIIDGLPYAKVYFIIGHDNKNWRKNEEFASKIHKKIETSHPGISRGVWGKTGSPGNNGEYNQSVSPNSVLIEVGGIDNTGEELKRTSVVLAEIIASLYWEEQQVEKANASIKP